MSTFLKKLGDKLDIFHMGISSDIPARETVFSLDHITEIRADWRKALDASNLRFEFVGPNVEREIIQMRHPSLR